LFDSSFLLSSSLSLSLSLSSDMTRRELGLKNTIFYSNSFSILICFLWKCFIQSLTTTWPKWIDTVFLSTVFGTEWHFHFHVLPLFERVVSTEHWYFDKLV
jgi:hypothetical protein